MSGNYVIHCSCGFEEEIEPQSLNHETIETAIKLMPALESMRDAGWDMGGLRGMVYEHAGQLVRVMLEHWRHGELSYSYSNNSDPPVVLKPPAEVGLPEPCGTCKGRRLIPCRACDGVEDLEALAAVEHESWGGWTKWMLSQMEKELRESAGEGAEMIDVLHVKRTILSLNALPCVIRWQRQMATPYAALSEKEKESDRKVAREKLGVYRP